ncbi:MAG: hypothetical protein J6V70_04645 [Kiritimatiellae bacterium]|nr:hypothetical protein [Kiritimatiellia bacterium]
MNKILFTGAIIFSMAFLANASAVISNLTECSAEKNNSIKVDGDLSDWDNANWIKVTKDNGVLDAGTRPLEGEKDLVFSFALAYNDEGLLVGVKVEDDKIVADSAKPGQDSAPAWDDDACEFFIDGNYNRVTNSRANNGEDLKFGGEFSIVANGAYTSDFSGYPHSFGKLWQGAAKQVKQHTDIERPICKKKGEVCRAAKQVKQHTDIEQGIVQYEYLIKWEAMGQTARPEKIGFNISLQDDDDGGRRDSALYFTGNPKTPFIDESQFGTVIFK